MKKLAKKLLCLTAVLALTLSLFTGCKSKNEKTLFEYAGQEVTFQNNVNNSFPGLYRGMIKSISM